MFRLDYHGGESVEVFSSKGRDPTKKWGVTGRAGAARRFDKEVRGFIFAVGSGGASKMSLPKSVRTPLGLLQPFLVLQVNVPTGGAFSCEVAANDSSAGARHRMLFSTAFRDATVSTLHAQVPIPMLPRGIWLNLVIDVAELLRTAWPGTPFGSIEGLTLNPTCLLRNVFTLRDAPRCTVDDVGPDAPPDTDHCYKRVCGIPRTNDFPASSALPHATVVINSVHVAWQLSVVGGTGEWKALLRAGDAAREVRRPGSGMKPSPVKAAGRGDLGGLSIQGMGVGGSSSAGGAVPPLARAQGAHGSGRVFRSPGSVRRRPKPAPSSARSAPRVEVAFGHRVDPDKAPRSLTSRTDGSSSRPSVGPRAARSPEAREGWTSARSDTRTEDYAFTPRDSPRDYPAGLGPIARSLSHKEVRPEPSVSELRSRRLGSASARSPQAGFDREVRHDSSVPEFDDPREDPLLRTRKSAWEEDSGSPSRSLGVLASGTGALQGSFSQHALVDAAVGPSDEPVAHPSVDHAHRAVGSAKERQDYETSPWAGRASSEDLKPSPIEAASTATERAKARTAGQLVSPPRAIASPAPVRRHTSTSSAEFLMSDDAEDGLAVSHSRRSGPSVRYSSGEDADLAARLSPPRHQTHRSISDPIFHESIEHDGSIDSSTYVRRSTGSVPPLRRSASPISLAAREEEQSRISLGDDVKFLIGVGRDATSMPARRQDVPTSPSDERRVSSERQGTSGRDDCEDASAGVVGEIAVIGSAADESRASGYDSDDEAGRATRQFEYDESRRPEFRQSLPRPARHGSDQSSPRHEFRPATAPGKYEFDDELVAGRQPASASDDVDRLGARDGSRDEMSHNRRRFVYDDSRQPIARRSDEDVSYHKRDSREFERSSARERPETAPSKYEYDEPVPTRGDPDADTYHVAVSRSGEYGREALGVSENRRPEAVDGDDSGLPGDVGHNKVSSPPRIQRAADAEDTRPDDPATVDQAEGAHVSPFRAAAEARVPVAVDKDMQGVEHASPAGHSKGDIVSGSADADAHDPHNSTGVSIISHNSRLSKLTEDDAPPLTVSPARKRSPGHAGSDPPLSPDMDTQTLASALARKREQLLEQQARLREMEASYDRLFGAAKEDTNERAVDVAGPTKPLGDTWGSSVSGSFNFDPDNAEVGEDSQSLSASGPLRWDTAVVADGDGSREESEDDLVNIGASSQAFKGIVLDTGDPQEISLGIEYGEAWDDDDVVELVFDEILNCYFDPKTNKYYDVDPDAGDTAVPNTAT